MKPFMDDNFLLHTETARELFFRYAQEMPIFDYHSHLPPEQIAGDINFENLSTVWLGGDHYKWRQMRTNGVPEELVTGSASDEEKFAAWAETVSQAIGNPLYHWTHLELQRYFNIREILKPETASMIYKEATESLQSPEFSVRNLLTRSNVKALCTTDDPADDLAHHRKIAADGFSVKVLPTFRPDKAMNFEDPAAFRKYLPVLEEASGVSIDSFGNLITALDKRHLYFHENGCRISDHALTFPVYQDAADSELTELFRKLISPKGELSRIEGEKLKTAVLRECGRMNARRGWTMQIHIGALRNNNSRLFASLGPDTGFDAIADEPIADALAKFLDSLDSSDELPKTILYVLNPRDNYVIGSLIGCYQDGSIPGKMQFGTAWWFNDQIDGMQMQMKTLANLGLLSRFVGMLTDSRSYLSFPRHEYFRRILCNIMGTWVEQGEAPRDMKLLGSIVKNISFRNAENYFGIDL